VCSSDLVSPICVLCSFFVVATSKVSPYLCSVFSLCCHCLHRWYNQGLYICKHVEHYI